MGLCVSLIRALIWPFGSSTNCAYVILFYFILFYKFAIAIDLYRVLRLQMTGISTQRYSSPITGFQKRTTNGISNYFEVKANITYN
jgi:uncharacterized membrane protein